MVISPCQLPTFRNVSQIFLNEKVKKKNKKQHNKKIKTTIDLHNVESKKRYCGTLASSTTTCQ